MHHKTRGEKRLGSITYSLLAEWSGLTLHTVRTYAARGHFEGKTVEELIAWANSRRAAAGLPLIGMPTAEVLPPIIASKSGERPDNGVEIVWSTDPEFVRKMDEAETEAEGGDSVSSEDKQ
jgi:hypothetical protein